MKLTIIGASGHGKVVADIALKCGYETIEFLDDNIGVDNCGKWKVVGKTELADYITNDLFVAIGKTETRRMIMEKYSKKNFATLIHPDSVITDNVNIGCGSVIMAGTVINSDVIVGKGCIINTCSSIDHDCIIGDYCHISVGSHICGSVKIGESTWIGAGAIVINNLNICENCMIGASATITKDIIESGTYVGIPAQKI